MINPELPAARCAWLRLVLRALAVGALGVSSWIALPIATAYADACPNAAFRFGAGANLPDCRGYELVSPVDTNGYDINFGDQAVAPDGNTVTYESLGAFAGAVGAPTSNQYLSTRNPVSGWSTASISPPQDPDFFSPQGSLFQGSSSDLSRAVFESDHTALDGAVPGTLDMYLRQPDGTFQLLDPGEPLGASQRPGFQGGSADLSRVVFVSLGALTPDAPNDGRFKLYEWEADGTGGCAAGAGCLSLVSVLPGGTPTDGIAGISPTDPWPNVVSSDGSRVYWFPFGQATNLYLWQNGVSTSIFCNPQTFAKCPTSPSGVWWTASKDGSVALYTSNEKLTSDSTASTKGYGDLYAYHASPAAGQPQLQDLTVDPGSTASVQGVIGASDDASYVYFVANGVLPNSGATTAGTCRSAAGSTTGTCNLYVWHAGSPGTPGTTTYIGQLSGADVADFPEPDTNTYEAFGQSEAAQVSSDGLHLLFTSVAPLTGFNNGARKEIFLYDAGSTPGTLTCVSCSGSAPAYDAVLSAPADVGFGQINAKDTPLNNMASDGSVVFFETPNPLVAGATNGSDNVYEWEADGAGSCASAGGCLYLIAAGQLLPNSGDPVQGAHFLGASQSGNDVFFLDREALTGQANGHNLDVYDARVEGGFPPPAAIASCTANACRSASASGLPGIPLVASVLFTGSGNPAPTAPPSLTVLNRAVHGSTFFIRVRVPVAGVVAIKGRWIRSLRRSVARPGTYVFRLTLTRRAKRLLAQKHKLRPMLRVIYTPAAGSASVANVRITVKPRRAASGRGHR